MDKAVRALFNLHPGESRKLILFILLGLMWSIGTYGVFTLSEGMFLEHVGAKGLPLTYVLVSLSLCALSTLLLFGLRRFSIKRLLLLIVAFWMVVSMIALFLFPYAQHSTAFWYSFKVIGWIMPISTYICYWSFIDQYVDLQDGKRLFCLINSVTFLGDACGSGLISFVIGSWGFQGLMSFYALLLFLALPAIYYITRHLSPILEEHHDHSESRSSLSLMEIVRRVMRSRFTLYLLGFYFMMQLVAIVTEFRYMSCFDAQFGNLPEHHLAQFLGRCNMWIALGNVFMGLFAYSRLVRGMGVQNLVVIAPTFFLLLFSLCFWREGLSLAILGLIAREGMVYTFDDNNLNLLISGVPSKIKNQVRITVESFFEPFGMLFGALLLFFFQQQSVVLGFMMAAVACIIVMLLRFEYPKAIFSNLVASSIRFGKTALDWIPKKERRLFEFHLLSNLKSVDEPSCLLAFEYLLKMSNTSHLPRLLQQMNLFSIPSKLKAIELLGESPWATEPIVIEALERWRRMLSHPSVSSSIQFYFACHSLLRPERIAHNLDHEQLGLKAAAILTLKTAVQPTPLLLSLASEQLLQLLASKIDREICIGIEILGREKNPIHVAQLIPYLSHSSKSVHREAARAIARIADKSCCHYAEALIHHLISNREAEVCTLLLKALENIADPTTVRELILAAAHFKPQERCMLQRVVLNIPHVSEIVLLEILKNRFVHERCRLIAGKILARLKPIILKQQLFEIVNREIERAYFYIYHFETMRHQEGDLSILLNALETGYHVSIDFVIQLIGTASSLEECEVLSHTLRSRNQKLRAQAVETLQKTCHIKLFSILEPLIDARAFEKKLRHYLKRGFIPLKLTQLLDILAESPSLTDQMVAVWMKAKLQTSDWKELLHQKMQDNEEIFRHFAQELLEEAHETTQSHR